MTLARYFLAVLAGHLRHRWQTPSGYREVLLLAWPLVLSTGSHTIQQFVNRVFLSWYSPEALAASLPAGSLAFTVMCFFIGTASYANTFVAQYHGAKQHDRIASSVWQAIYLSLIASVLILPFAFLSGSLFRLADHEPGVQGLESTYFRILILGGGFSILSSAVAAFFTGRGLTATVMKVNVGATILNGALDYVLIFGKLGLPNMGIAGAAYATVISQAVAALWFLGLFLWGTDGRAYGVWRTRSFDRELFGRMLRFGAPSGLHFMLDLLSWSLFILLVGRLGTAELGATNLAFQVNSIIFMPMIGFSIATATLVGQRLGENRSDLAARATWSSFHLTFAYMVVFAVLYVTIPVVFLLPFGAKADPVKFAPLQDMAVVMMRFVALYSLFDSANLIFSAALKGAGDTLFVMIVSAALALGIMVLPTWIICVDGEGSIWAAWTALTVFISVLAFFFLWRFLQGRWRTMRVTETIHAPLNPTYPGPETPIVEVEVST